MRAGTSGAPPFEWEDPVSRRGFTLIEILVVVVIVGVLMLIGFPRIQDQVARSDVRSAASRLASVYAQARANAISTGRPTRFIPVGNRVVVTTGAGGVSDTVGVVHHLDSLYQVTVTLNEYADDLIEIDARGILSQPLAGDAVITVTRGTYSRAITIGRYGSIAIQ